MKIIYTYDKAQGGQPIGDLRKYAGGSIKYVKMLNGIGTLSFNLSFSAIYEFCNQYQFDISRFFTPLKSSVQLYDDNNVLIGEYFLGATPAFSFAENPDAEVSLEFFDGLGMCRFWNFKNPETFNGELSAWLVQNYNEALATASSAGAPWAISLGSKIDTLGNVQDTQGLGKALSDFLVERTDNTSGAGQFDIYFNKNSELEIWRKYGTDIRATTTLTFPNKGQLNAVSGVSFDSWNNFYSDIYLVGEGEGTEAVTATRRNPVALVNTGFSERYAQNSELTENNIDAQASGYLAYTGSFLGMPKISLDDVFAQNHKIYDHRDGGTFWVGDTLNFKIIGDYVDFFPSPEFNNMRVEKLDISVDANDAKTIDVEFTPLPGESNVI